MRIRRLRELLFLRLRQFRRLLLPLRLLLFLRDLWHSFTLNLNLGRSHSFKVVVLFGRVAIRRSVFILMFTRRRRLRLLSLVLKSRDVVRDRNPRLSSNRSLSINRLCRNQDRLIRFTAWRLPQFLRKSEAIPIFLTLVLHLVVLPTTIAWCETRICSI